MLKNIISFMTLLLLIIGCGTSNKKDSNNTLEPTLPPPQTTPSPREVTPIPTPKEVTPTPTKQRVQTRFTRDPNKEVVTDNIEQIMWQDDIRAKKTKACWLTDNDFLDCQAGMPQQHRPSCDNYDSVENCNTGFTPLPRYTAYKVCANLILGGYNDWHVPTISDLNSIIDTSREKAPFINPIFKNTTSLQYWSSSSLERTAPLAWVIFLGNREASHVKFDKNTEIGIRCVRDIR